MGSGVAAIASGWEHKCALRTDWSVISWGYNYHKQLGDGTSTDRYTPTAVSGLSSGVTAIAASLGGTTRVPFSLAGPPCAGERGISRLGL